MFSLRTDLPCPLEALADNGNPYGYSLVDCDHCGRPLTRREYEDYLDADWDEGGYFAIGEHLCCACRK